VRRSANSANFIPLKCEEILFGQKVSLGRVSKLMQIRAHRGAGCTDWRRQKGGRRGWRAARMTPSHISAGQGAGVAPIVIVLGGTASKCAQTSFISLIWAAAIYLPWLPFVDGACREIYISQTWRSFIFIRPPPLPTQPGPMRERGNRLSWSLRSHYRQTARYYSVYVCV
jgi:hypothetical protein